MHIVAANTDHFSNPKKYYGIQLQDLFHIEELFSLHYFEYMSTFSFPGESHDFWEFVCVDKGEVEIGAGPLTHTQTRRNRFHYPGEFHWVKANGKIAPNLIVISFSCTDPAMEFFRGKILHLEETERRLLAGIIAEAGSFWKDGWTIPIRHPSDQKRYIPVCGQLIRLHLEELLLSLYRRNQNSLLTGEVSRTPLSDRTLSKNTDAELFSHIKNYLLSHLADHLTIEQICHDNLISRSRLQKLFRDSEGTGVIEYYSALKISEAKSMIRSGQMNFTQISEYLGYSSIHYFSRQFKRSTGMTPSEYVSSIRALADEGHKKHNAISLNTKNHQSPHSLSMKA